MSDALVSPAVAVTAGAVAVALVATAAVRLKREYTPHTLPMMGVLGAFVFAAQMLNFAIPGTGSSGHLVGGVLLAAMLGPWAAFLTLTAVLTLQCLLFADGGLMALGCNILNMAAVSCLVVYPLLFRPVAGPAMSFGRMSLAAVVSCVMALLLGSAAVTLETEMSGVTALPTPTFLGFMLPIHMVIGLVEGVATALVLGVVRRAEPAMLETLSRDVETTARPARPVMTLAVVAVVAVACAAWIPTVASEWPDGLEWSLLRTAETENPSAEPSAMSAAAASVVSATALLPDYKGALAGVIGALILVTVAFVVAWAVRSPWPRRRKRDGR
ncbi:MAG: energy-coupling factor ABC transporter permease [Rikenellaceae bacterium]|nr:energy-coupling factor ABC transporter permease [Rikenellaceae bacterium]